MLIVVTLYFILLVLKQVNVGGSCDNINNPYAKLFVSDVAKNINIKVFYLMSRTNQRRLINWYETCKCKCRLDASVGIINIVGIKINADVNVTN